MVIKDISFVGFLKLNTFLILLPSLLSIFMSRIVRMANPQDYLADLRSADILTQNPDSSPPALPDPQNPQDVSTMLEAILVFAPAILTPFILVYVLAKVIHVLAQNTKIGDIVIGQMDT